MIDFRVDSSKFLPFRFSTKSSKLYWFIIICLDVILLLMKVFNEDEKSFRVLWWVSSHFRVVVHDLERDCTKFGQTNEAQMLLDCSITKLRRDCTVLGQDYLTLAEITMALGEFIKEKLQGWSMSNFQWTWVYFNGV